MATHLLGQALKPTAVAARRVGTAPRSRADSLRVPLSANIRHPALEQADRVRAAVPPCSALPSASTTGVDVDVEETVEREIKPGVFEGFWRWNGYKIRYQRSGDSGPPVLLVHGFGANADHWRKNTPALGENCRAYAIDLLGYGYSDKPTPDKDNPNQIYNFENWSQQLRDFQREVMGGPSFICCNSVGGIAGLQAAVDEPEMVLGVQIINISLRMLHVDNQLPIMRPLVKAFQDTLRKSTIGQAFFDNLATPNTVKQTLQQAYFDPDTVTDELVECVLNPGKEPGAVDVFLDFISYSGGPLPRDLIERTTRPVSMVWGAEDPWEKIEWGRELSSIEGVEEFVELPGVGHCPQDEAPDQVNPLIERFVMRHA